MSIHGIKNAEVLDYDSDGDLDVLGSAENYGTILYLENDGSEVLR